MTNWFKWYELSQEQTAHVNSDDEVKTLIQLSRMKNKVYNLKDFMNVVIVRSYQGTVNKLILINKIEEIGKAGRISLSDATLLARMIFKWYYQSFIG